MEPEQPEGSGHSLQPPPAPPPPRAYDAAQGGGSATGSGVPVPPPPPVAGSVNGAHVDSVAQGAGQVLPPPPPPGRPGLGLRKGVESQPGYAQGQPPTPGYSQPYASYTTGGMGFPMWAWGAIGAVVIVLLGGGVLVAALALNNSNGGGGGGNLSFLPGQFSTNIGPPDWVKPGTRITFYNAAASVAQSSYAWIDDPNCKANCWVDPKTGKLYSRTDQIPDATMGWASGDGLTQIDILAVQGTDIIWSANSYPIDRSANSPVFAAPIPLGGKAPGTAVDGAWIHPTLLNQLENYNQDGLLILRGKYPWNGVTYDALGFAVSLNGSFQQYTYDTQTGLLLSATTNTKGATSPLRPEGGNPPQGNSQLTISRLAGSRQRTMPGVNGNNPSWVGNTNQLSYSGTYHLVNPVDPSSMQVDAPMVADVTIGEHGSNWAVLTVRSQIQLQGYQPSVTTGASGPGGVYWVDPQALATMSGQQLLDEDPLTGERVEVASVGQGPRGTAVSIVSRMNGVETDLTYDQATGVLVNLKQIVPRAGTTIELGLQKGP